MGEGTIVTREDGKIRDIDRKCFNIDGDFPSGRSGDIRDFDAFGDDTGLPEGVKLDLLHWFCGRSGRRYVLVLGGVF